MPVKHNQPTSFIAGLTAGFLIGALVLTPIAILTLAYLFSRSNANQSIGFIIIYVLGAALGLWGLWLTKMRVGFVSGLIMGGSAGLLGLTAVCNVIVGGLGNMH